MTAWSIFIVDDERHPEDWIASSRAAVRAFPGRGVRRQPSADPPDSFSWTSGCRMSGVEGPGDRPFVETLIVVVTAYEDVQTVVGAMKGGAFDYR
jgi:hypothetical protein